jgi:hypothetical protein
MERIVLLTMAVLISMKPMEVGMEEMLLIKAIMEDAVVEVRVDFILVV